MSTENERVRHSVAAPAQVLTHREEIARREAANALRQAERVRDIVFASLDGRPFKLRPSTLLDLNRCAIEGINSYAGNWRPGPVEIGDSQHRPPDSHLVPELIEQLCDYVNENWSERSSLHLASFVMWRLNWIHPFTDGNGRTARAASYTVLCAHSGAWLPGALTIPEQIIANRVPYYEALEDADKKYMVGKPFPSNIVSALESLMAGMFAKQLRSAFDTAVMADVDVLAEHIAERPDKASQSGTTRD